MERLTHKLSDGEYAVDCENQQLIRRLAGYEDMYEALCAQRDRVNADMEVLRSQGKNKTVTFKQLLVDKLSISGMISRIEFWFPDDKG